MDKPASVLIIEDDRAIANLTTGILEEMGIGDVRSDEFGLHAWNAAQYKIFDMIILDWKLSDISGLALVNRFRQHPNYRTTPILVMSGFLQKKDLSLVDGLPFTDQLEKPFMAKIVQRKIKKLKAECNWFKNKEKEIHTHLRCLHKGQGEKVQILLSMLQESQKPAVLGVAAAKALETQGQRHLAQKILDHVLKNQPQSVQALMEYGKILLRQGKYKEAKTVLQSAHKLIPDDCERLCLLGKIKLNELAPREAEAYFRRVLSIDPRHKIAHEGSLLATNISKYLAQTTQTALPDTFASLLNSIGIALVRNGGFKKGLGHYNAALRYVISPEDRSKVAFNIGMGYLRWEKPQQALPWFSKAVEICQTFMKARKHERKLRQILGDQRCELTENQVQKVATTAPLIDAPVEYSDVDHDCDLDTENLDESIISAA